MTEPRDPPAGAQLRAGAHARGAARFGVVAFVHKRVTQWLPGLR